MGSNTVPSNKAPSRLKLRSALGLCLIARLKMKKQVHFLSLKRLNKISSSNNPQELFEWLQHHLHRSYCTLTQTKQTNCSKKSLVSNRKVQQPFSVLHNMKLFGISFLLKFYLYCINNFEYTLVPNYTLLVVKYFENPVKTNNTLQILTFLKGSL